jgi:LPXTG-site transpeptidase (sortase) family protein
MYAFNKTFKNKKSVLSVENNLENLSQNIEIKNSTSAENILNKENQDKLENNTIFIPSIDLEAEVKELKSIEDLHTGSWRRPETSTPDKGGNTVIIAHRYTRKNGESGPNTFYFLPKVQMGEKIFVSYEKKMYEYEVTEIKVVEPEDVHFTPARHCGHPASVM